MLVVIEPTKSKGEGDAIQKILNFVGVEYSHANEALLRPSHVEGQVTEHAIKVTSNSIVPKTHRKQLLTVFL
jgi:Helicase-associated putative binding domain, C-terminal